MTVRPRTLLSVIGMMKKCNKPESDMTELTTANIGVTNCLETLYIVFASLAKMRILKVIASGRMSGTG